MPSKIKLSISRPAGVGEYVDSIYDWGDDVFLQGGYRGIVLSEKGKHYSTCFIEAFPEGTFIRGEGETLEEAEKAAWDKHQKYLACQGHDWETRGYTNGAGFCKNCNRFQSHCFTGEQLKQYCYFCGTGTTYGQTTVLNDNWEWVEDWVCEAHFIGAQINRYLFLKRKETSSLTDKEKTEFSQLQWLLKREPDTVDEKEIGEAISDILTALVKNNDEDTV